MKTTFKTLWPIILLAAAAGLQMTGALLFFNTPVDILLILSYILITFAIYLLNKFTDCEDGFNCPEQKMFYQEKAKLILVPIFMLVVSMVFLSISRKLSFWHILLITSGTLYSHKLIPQWKNQVVYFVRMKDILFVKNLSVCLLWGITPFAIAASQTASKPPSYSDLVVVILAFCVTTLINTTTCDVRDVNGDRHVGITTVPAKYGKRFTKLYLFFMGLLTSFIVGVFCLAGVISPQVCTLYLAAVIWTAVVVFPIYSDKIMLPRKITEPLVETQQLFCGAALITLALL